MSSKPKFRSEFGLAALIQNLEVKRNGRGMARGFSLSTRCIVVNLAMVMLSKLS